MEEVLREIKELITSDNIALLSVITTVLIFVASRHIEISYKKPDDKKIQYLKLLSLMEKFMSGVNTDKRGQITLSSDLKQQFFDTGASLLLYG